MASPAAAKFEEGATRAQILTNLVTDRRLRPIPRFNAQVFMHAGLAALVAGWETYLNELARAFFAAIANPLDSRFHTIHEVARATLDRAAEHFHTPNWENSRMFLVNTTGYDPISDWQWPAGRLGVKGVQDRLNQILKVRHSFAHGFEIPSYPWTQGASGIVRLTLGEVRYCETFFRNLVKRTDSGMAAYLQLRYGQNASW